VSIKQKEGNMAFQRTGTVVIGKRGRPIDSSKVALAEEAIREGGAYIQRGLATKEDAKLVAGAFYQFLRKNYKERLRAQVDAETDGTFSALLIKE
jgi:hypothetical protein